MAKKTIEAEGGELVLQNEAGDTIIIPKTSRSKALKMLENNDHAGIDSLAGNLPYMEDYAADGSLIPGLNVSVPSDIPTTGVSDTKVVHTKTVPDEIKPKEKTTETVPKGIYSSEEEEKLRTRYGSGEMAAYKEFGCLGSSCRNFGKVYPGLPNYYEELSQKGVYNEPVETDYSQLTGPALEKARKGNSPGPDSWEISQILEEEGLGEKIFGIDPDKPDPSFIQDYDYSSLPLGTILSFGDARGVYTNPKGKSYRGKEEPLYRHSATVMGYAEGTDLEGKPAVDVLIDDLGQIQRIGKSTEAEKTWGDYTTDRKSLPLYGATARESTKKWTYSELKSRQSPEEVKAQKEKVKAETYNKYLDNLEQDLVAGKYPKDSHSFKTGMKLLDERDKKRAQENE